MAAGFLNSAVTFGPVVSAGTQQASSGTVIFSNANGVSFGMSNSSVVTASIATVQGSIGVSAGTSSANLSAVTFSNSNGISFGLNGSVVTASVNVSALDLAAIGAGAQTATSGTVNFANANGISFGMSGSSQITASANSLAAAAGTQTATSGTVVFSNSNGVSFGMSNSSVLTASFGQSVTCFSQDADFVTNFRISQATLSLQKLSFPMNLSATQLAILADFAGATNSSGAVTVSHAVYTLSGGSANLASSASAQFSWTSGSATTATSVYGGASGTRYRTIGVNYSLTPGDYLFGWWVQATNGVSVNLYGRAGVNIVGTYQGVETSYFMNGTSNSSFLSAFPSIIAATDTNYARTGVAALRQPGAILVGSGG